MERTRYILRTEDEDRNVSGFIRQYGYIFIEDKEHDKWTAFIEADEESEDYNGIIVDKDKARELKLCGTPMIFDSFESATSFIHEYGAAIKDVADFAREEDDKLTEILAEEARIKEGKCRAAHDYILFNQAGRGIKYHGRLLIGVGMKVEFKINLKGGNGEYLFHKDNKGIISYKVFSRVKGRDINKFADVEDAVKIFLDTRNNSSVIKCDVEQEEAKKFLSLCNGDSIDCLSSDRFALTLSKNGVKPVCLSEREFEKILKKYKAYFLPEGEGEIADMFQCDRKSLSELLSANPKPLHSNV